MHRRFTTIALVAFAALAAACSASNGSTGTGNSSGGGSGVTSGDGTAAGSGGFTGTMEVRLVDAPSTDVTEIVVTIVKVEIHPSGGGWQTIGNVKQTIDLLKLQGGTFRSLGVSQWPAGKITELRLYVDDAGPNYVSTPDGQQHPLVVPSGDESGIKLKGGFEVPACATGALTIDFDGKNSIFTHPRGGGSGDEWTLRPVVRVKSLSFSGSCPDGGTDAATSSDGSTSSDAATNGDGAAPPNGDGVPGDLRLDPSDPCLGVTCPDTQLCVNGQCRTPIY